MTFAIDFARLCLWLVLLATVFVTLEHLFALRPKPVLRKWLLADVGYYFLTSLTPSLLLSAPLALVAWGLHAMTMPMLLSMSTAWPMWGRWAAAFVVGEIGSYWGHRWSHEIPLLWRFHAIHHSAEHIDWLVNTRAHPVDLVFSRLCGLVPLYVVGLAGPTSVGGTATPVAIVLIVTMWGYFIHANVRWRFGWLEWVLATPAFHHWHHTNCNRRDHNYASTLPVLDAVFGTLHLPLRKWPDSLGVDTPVAASFAGQLIDPLLPARWKNPFEDRAQHVAAHREHQHM